MWYAYKIKVCEFVFTYPDKHPDTNQSKGVSSRYLVHSGTKHWDFFPQILPHFFNIFTDFAWRQQPRHLFSTVFTVIIRNDCVTLGKNLSVDLPFARAHRVSVSEDAFSAGFRQKQEATFILTNFKQLEEAHGEVTWTIRPKQLNTWSANTNNTDILMKAWNRNVQTLPTRASFKTYLSVSQ